MDAVAVQVLARALVLRVDRLSQDMLECQERMTQGWTSNLPNINDIRLLVVDEDVVLTQVGVHQSAGG